MGILSIFYWGLEVDVIYSILYIKLILKVKGNSCKIFNDEKIVGNFLGVCGFKDIGFKLREKIIGGFF